MYSLLELFDKCLYATYENVGNDVSYTFEEEEDLLYIYFQCSYSKIDWFYNFLFKKLPYNEMNIPFKVHGGFLTCWKEVDDIIIKKITELDNSGSYRWKKIIIVGYSHGAALAMLCHECCWFHRNDIVENIKTLAFDGPRVFGESEIAPELAERWKNFILFRNHTDIVTHVPPKFLGFQHVGKLIQIGESATYSCFASHKDPNITKSLKELPYNDSWETYLFS